MGYLAEQVQSLALKLVDYIIDKIFDSGEPSLSDVVTQMLESDCRKI